MFALFFERSPVQYVSTFSFWVVLATLALKQRGLWQERQAYRRAQEILASLTTKFVETMDEVLQVALERPIQPQEPAAVAPVAETFATGAEKDASLTN